jgi:hypothetical protein
MGSLLLGEPAFFAADVPPVDPERAPPCTDSEHAAAAIAPA